MKMRVISIDGNSCNLRQACVRTMYRIIDGLFFGIVAFSYMKPAVYQRLGDRKAATFVVASNDPVVKTQPEGWKFWIALFLYLLLNIIAIIILILIRCRFR